MADKSSLGEFLWLMRLKQGTFLEPQIPLETFSGSEPCLARGFTGGEADSVLSVLNRASESFTYEAEDA